MISQVSLHLRVLQQSMSEQLPAQTKRFPVKLERFSLILCFRVKYLAEKVGVGSVMTNTLVPGWSPLSCGGVTWVLWCSSLCSIRSLMYRKWRRHLLQLSTCFFWRHRHTKTDSGFVSGHRCLGLTGCGASVDLVADDVLLVAGTQAQHSEAVRTHQVSGVWVNRPEVSPDVRVEGRAEVAHLRAKRKAWWVRVKGSRKWRLVSGTTDLTEIRHLSWMVSVFHVIHEGWLIVESQLTDLTCYCRKTWKRKTMSFTLRFKVLLCLLIFSDQLLKIWYVVMRQKFFFVSHLLKK